MKLYDANIWNEFSDPKRGFEMFEENQDEVFIKFNEFVQMLENRGETCIDSFRIMELEKSNSIIPYEYNKLNTCCGSDDIKYEINGKYYIFGANFGH